MTHFLEQMRHRVIERVRQMEFQTVNRHSIKDFCSVFNAYPTVIAEIKFSSPSRGRIYQGHLTAVEIAQSYVAAGARALSILTEPHYFNGHIQTLHEVHQVLPDCPLLLKDFVLSPIQIQQAYCFGASAVLLIAGFLEPSLLETLYEYTHSLGLTPFVEVHDAQELAQVLRLNPKIIGINNRNLRTLSIDLTVSQTLIQDIPDEVMVVCESGIASAKDIKTMCDLQCDGFLIGSHLMQSNHPGDALRDLLKEVSHAY